MPKHPFMKFFPAEFMADTAILNTDAIGCWALLMCELWRKSDGTKEFAIDELGALWKKDDEAAHRILEKLAIETLDLEKVETPTGTIFRVTARRIKRDKKELRGGADRQQRMRDNGGGDPLRWLATRARILERDKNRCAYCGRKASTVDHIIPRAYGGDESDENLTGCCSACNGMKNDRSLKSFKEILGHEFYDESRVYNAEHHAAEVQKFRSSEKTKEVKDTSLLSSAAETGAPDAKRTEPSKTGATPLESKEKRQGDDVLDTSPILFEFPVKAAPGQPRAWALRESKVGQYRTTFTGVPVDAEITKARQWLVDNPTRQKTARGMPKFLFGWLERKNNRHVGGWNGQPRQDGFATATPGKYTKQN